VFYAEMIGAHILVSGSCGGVSILANRVDSFLFPICPLTNTPGTFPFYFSSFFLVLDGKRAKTLLASGGDSDMYRCAARLI
jgi:hypothetical protein